MYLCSVDVSQKPGPCGGRLDVRKDVRVCFLTIVDKKASERGAGVQFPHYTPSVLLPLVNDKPEAQRHEDPYLWSRRKTAEE